MMRTAAAVLLASFVLTGGTALAAEPTATPSDTPCVSGRDAVKVVGFGPGWAEIDVADNACGDTVVTLAAYQMPGAGQFPQQLVASDSGIGRLEVEVPTCGQVDLVLGTDVPGELSGPYFTPRGTLLRSWGAPASACAPATTPSPTPSETATPSPSPSDTPSETPAPSATPTATSSPSDTPTPTGTPSPTLSPSETPTVVPSDTPSPTPPVVVSIPAGETPTPVPATVAPRPTASASSPARTVPPRRATTTPVGASARPTDVAPVSVPTPTPSDTPTVVAQPDVSSASYATDELAHTGGPGWAILWIFGWGVFLLACGVLVYTKARRNDDLDL